MGGAETAFADWTPESLEPHDENVEVYSNCKDVALLLNGKSLGSKMRNADDAPRTWTVTFAPGSLQAVCDDSKTQETLKTAGKPDWILLTPESTHVGSEFDDVVRLRAVVMDGPGARVPRDASKLKFAVSGPGEIVAVDNGDFASHEPFQATERSAYDGTAIVYVRATAKTGKIRVSVSADGLSDGVAVLQAGKR